VTGPDGIYLTKIYERPVRGPKVGDAMRGASAGVAAVGGEPRLREESRPVVVRGIDDLIADGRAETAGIAACIQNDGGAGVSGVDVNALELAAVPVEIVGPLA